MSKNHEEFIQPTDLPEENKSLILGRLGTGTMLRRESPPCIQAEEETES